MGGPQICYRRPGCSPLSTRRLCRRDICDKVILTSIQPQSQRTWGWHFPLVSKHFIPILSETSNFLLEACRERAHLPHKQIVPVTQLTWGCMLACEGSAAAGGSNTHALLCVNPAPPVAQSGSSPCHPHVMCWNKLCLQPFWSPPTPHARSHITYTWWCVKTYSFYRLQTSRNCTVQDSHSKAEQMEGWDEISILRDAVNSRMTTDCQSGIFSPDLNLKISYTQWQCFMCWIHPTLCVCAQTASYKNHCGMFCQQSGSVSTTIAGNRRPPSPSREYTSLSTLGQPDMIEDSWGVKRSDRACK